MTKFVYKMEDILEIKIQLEDQAKTEYANARRLLFIEEDKLKKLFLEHDVFQEKLTDLISSKIELLEIQKCKDAIELYKEYIEQQKKKLAIAEHNEEIARLNLQEAMIERKTYDKLKEKAREEYMYEYESWQQKEIDEITSYRYGILAQNKEDINAG
ncbi:MAG TPA: flagellar export protein FliJ [Clostridiales bacterium]|nr:flagellar export protein FliJ [Clostridiales bacterium]